MPVRYTVGSGGLFVHAVAHGVLTSDDIRQYINDISQDDRVRPGFREIFDVCAIKESQVIPEVFGDIHKLILNDPKRKRGSKLAIVVSTNSSFNNAQRYERSVMPDVQHVIVFNDVHTAKIWLGVTDARTISPAESNRG